jgi:hypothetical protein
MGGLGLDDCELSTVFPVSIYQPYPVDFLSTGWTSGSNEISKGEK